MPPLLAIVLTLLATGAAAAGAQRPPESVLRGQVVSAADGAPIERALVYALDAGGQRAGTAAVTTPAGAFYLRLSAAAAGRAVVARIGFAPETLTVAPAGEVRVMVRMREAPLALAPTVVQAERSLSAASSAVVRELDVRLRPRESGQELLRLAPGLVIAQHAGGGKAEQIFLRGFDADHGTDVAVSVDGVPVNMPTHAHGQGYADLHFLMPEVVEGAEVRKGPYDARDGDFAAAGSVSFRTRDRVAAPTLAVRGGSFGTVHAAALMPLGGGPGRPGGYAAASAHASEGPFEARQGHRRANGFAKWTAPAGPGAELVATASAFAARWDASGQIPERAVRAGRIGRFGAVGPTEGGTTARYDAGVALRQRGDAASVWEARAWATRYRLDLFSDFTYFLNDPELGDGIEQVDERTVVGGGAHYGRAATVAGLPASWSVGAGARADAGDVALHHQRQRERLGSRVDARSRQAQLFQWARYELHPTPRLRLEAGLRGDLFRFSVADRLAGGGGGVAAGPDVRWHGIVSPKLSAALDAGDRTTLFANAGTGFHSNDARDVVRAGRGERVLPRAVGGELGVRHTWPAGSVAAALWMLDLQSELVYVGDEGTTEASGRTRRTGADLEARVRLARWLWADADLNLARGRFRDAPAGADRVPLAPTVTSTAGLTVRELGAWDGGLRLRQVGARAATEDNTVRARGYALWELFAGRQLTARARVVATVDNLLDASWNEAQFATTSRLRDEPAPVTELHFTPGAPRSAQVGVEWRF